MFAGHRGCGNCRLQLTKLTVRVRFSSPAPPRTPTLVRWVDGVDGGRCVGREPGPWVNGRADDGSCHGGWLLLNTHLDATQSLAHSRREHLLLHDADGAEQVLPPRRPVLDDDHVQSCAAASTDELAESIHADLDIRDYVHEAVGLLPRRHGLGRGPDAGWGGQPHRSVLEDGRRGLRPIRTSLTRPRSFRPGAR